MADTRTITLRQGHGTASTIVLRALPIPDVGTTTIVLRGLHATPATIILRNPLTIPEGGGGPTIVEADANSSGSSAISGLAGAIWNGAGVSEGSSAVSGLSAAIWNGEGFSGGSATVQGLAATVFSALASSEGVSSASADGSTIRTGVGASSGSSNLDGMAVAVWAALAEASAGSTANAESEDIGAPPTITIIGGDDAPRSRRKRRKERRDIFREMEATIHGLLHPESKPVQEVGVEPATPGAARRALDELVVLAQGHHGLLQRASALRAELAGVEDAQDRMMEQDEEEALLCMF